MSPVSALLLSLVTLFLFVHHAAPVAAGQQEADDQTLDSAATTLGGLRSWIQTRPDMAVRALSIGDELLAFGAAHVDHPKRGAQFRSGLDMWQQAIDEFERNAEKQIDSMLTRVEKAAERMRTRPSARSWVSACGNDLKRSREQMSVYTALGSVPDELVKRMQAVEALVKEIDAAIGEDELIPARPGVRARYRSDDLPALEEAVAEAFARAHPGAKLECVVVESMHWDRIYRCELRDGSLQKVEDEWIVAYAVSKVDDNTVRLHEFELVRDLPGRLAIEARERPRAARTILRKNVK